ncbi:hypothetical protein CISIN_1g034988mg [Citrus sinensis]|uniref:F-box domain-containing protein n=1 Tax=Citrus sinensis TaxID=2711 RepID=A0A067G3W5_CITSI|nr:hypothetical protein CISIN_1g034988mg [Citrus sinensis]
MAASSLKTPMPTPKKANWSDLLVELLVSILTHSSSLEILRSSIVCSLWNKIIRDHEQFLFFGSYCLRKPLKLMFISW